MAPKLQQFLVYNKKLIPNILISFYSNPFKHAKLEAETIPEYL